MKCFDFDKTLYRKDSAISFYFFYLSKFPLRVFGLLRVLWLFALNLLGFIKTREFKERYFAFVKNIPNIEEFVQKFWKKECKNINKFAYEKVADGDVIISASPKFLIEPAVHLINPNAVVFGTNFNLETNKIEGENLKGDEKVRLLEENGYTQFDEVYTDSLSDFPIMDLAEKKYIVCGKNFYEFGKQRPTLGVKLKYVIKQLRPKHYVKNGLIFLPLFFSGLLLDWGFVSRAIWGVVSFCLAASFVYVVNDLIDAKKDRKHTTKRKRPIASYMIKSWEAVAIACLLVLCNALVLGFVFGFNLAITAIVVGYAVLNIMYSFVFKRVPILDVFVLASFYMLRVFFGAIILGVGVSKWLYLTILCASLYMGFGKRRNEMRREDGETRKVNKAYNFNFLDKNLYLCLTMCLIFYALWVVEFRVNTIDYQNSILLLATIPVVFFIMMKYSLNIENPQNDGDPINVLLRDKVLILVCVLFIAMAVVSIYVPIVNLFGRVV